MNRSILSLTLLFALAMTACHTCPEKTPIIQQGSVTGVVMFQPGYDASNIGNDPADPIYKARPLSGVTIYLIKYPVPVIRRRHIITGAVTDTLGRYEINATPGGYFLAAFQPALGVLTVGWRDGTKVDGVDINELRVIEILPDTTTIQDFKLHEVVPQ